MTVAGAERKLEVLDILSRMPGLSWAYGTYLVARNNVSRARLVRTYGPRQIVRFLGCTLELDLTNSHDAQMFESILAVRAYETETTAIILNRLRPGDLFVDVGANNGYFSVLAASLVGGSGKVIAIEPAEGPFKRLQHNIELNGFAGRIQPVCAAASAKEGETTLFLNPWDDGWTSTNQPTRFPVSVRTLTLDSIVTPRDRVTVKIDVEGDELAVLEGMKAIIEGVPSLNVVVEWNRKYATAALRRFLFDTFVVSRIAPTGAGYDLRPIPESILLRGITLSNLWCEKRTGPRVVP